MFVHIHCPLIVMIVISLYIYILYLKYVYIYTYQLRKPVLLAWITASVAPSIAHGTDRLPRQLRGPHGGSGAEPDRLEACGKQHVAGRCDIVWPWTNWHMLTNLWFWFPPNVAGSKFEEFCIVVASWISFGLPRSQRNDAELSSWLVLGLHPQQRASVINHSNW